MSKSKLLSLAFSCLLVVFLASCGKDDDTNPSTTDLLTAGEWTGQEFWTQGRNVTETLRNLLEYDVAKSKANFSKDGSYSIKYDGTVIQSGAWRFGSGEQTVILDAATEDEATLNINKLSSSELYLESNESMGSGGFMLLEGEIRMKR